MREHFIEFDGERESNELRRRLAPLNRRVREPIRRRWPSLSEVRAVTTGRPKGGSWPTSPPVCWWPTWGTTPCAGGSAYWRICGLDQLPEEGPFAQMKTLTAYNAVTELEVMASERLLANMRSQPGGERMQQVLWAASGSEAIQKSLWAALARDPNRPMILATRRGFHGKKGLASAVTGYRAGSGSRSSRSLSFHFPTEDCCDVDARRRPLDLDPYRAGTRAGRPRNLATASAA